MKALQSPKIININQLVMQKSQQRDKTKTELAAHRARGDKQSPEQSAAKAFNFTAFDFDKLSHKNGY